ncbi:MAG TPA: sigma-70 family RNA polymerase sigma factor [Chitinophagales bacterium]|nr:sigma-70 family RNA polymerase sigma factor [Chitinophagales bacterium]
MSSDSFEQIAAIKANDEKTLKALYQNNYNKVRSFIISNNGTEEDAKDFFQEAYIITWKNIRENKFTPQNGTSLDGYLYTITKNKWMDYLRSNAYKIKKRTHGDLVNICAVRSDNESELESIELMKVCFSQLGENCQKLLTCYYFKKDSLKIIAEKFSWTEATAKNNKYRCIQKLKEIIKNK